MEHYSVDFPLSKVTSCMVADPFAILIAGIDTYAHLCNQAMDAPDLDPGNVCANA